MSQSDGGPGEREVAYRLFATEFDDADLSYSESDEERAPNYVVTPTGARVNRLFVVGVLTELEDVSDDVLRARVVDPTGAFVLYAGQYQPDERAALQRTEPPAFLAVTGKARTFQPEDSDRVFTSIRPESVTVVDAETRDRWNVQAAEQTLVRIQAMATALDLGLEGTDLETALRQRSVDEGLAEGVPLAIDHYGTTPTYLAGLQSVAIDVARLVAGEIDEVDDLVVGPDATGEATAADLLDAAGASSVEPVEDPGSDPAERTEPEAPEETVQEPATTESVDESRPVETDDESASNAGAVSDDGQVGDEAETESETTPRAETKPESTAESRSDAGDAESEASEEGEAEAADATGPGDFTLDESERTEIEEEYGTDFQTGTDVDEPGEADIETPEPESVDTPETPDEEEEPAEEGATEPAATSEAPTEEADVGEDEPPGDEGEPAEPETVEEADLSSVVLDVMEELDQGDGADRDEVVSTVADRTGADPEAVEDAIQEALMDGLCYEPDDATLKPI